MKVRLSELRQLIQQAILLEYTVAPDATLYHRSMVDHKVGDTLTAQMDPKTGKHWLSTREAEQDLESYRKKEHPDLPSRGAHCDNASLDCSCPGRGSPAVAP